MPNAITWKNGQRKLSELRPWGKNPRETTEEQARHLQISIDTFNFAQPFLISEESDLYDGHQRLSIMLDMSEYGPDYVADVRISSRLLTEDERRQLVIRLHENTGDWDWDMMPKIFPANAAHLKFCPVMLQFHYSGTLTLLVLSRN